ncbi:DUF2933 domain-containing protein [Ferrovum sp.]|uniref:DUF2933 domain-containing protein n=1 Tax=Ferrovum sp. TaxID=2609467 RepID=UPI00345BFB6D
MGARPKIAWLVFAVIAAFYLWTEHRAHLLGALPFLIFLACPLMHFFMHGGHGHAHDSSHDKLAPESRKENSHE